jgi:hypothetical protein
MKKITLENVLLFLHFRAVCEKFKIAFSYWTKPGGVYIVEAKITDLEAIGF